MKRQTNLLPDGEPAYDVYLSSPCTWMRALRRLTATYLPLADPLVQQKIRQQQPDFLGLNMSAASASTLLAALQEAGASGEVIAAAYREPLISMEQAAKFAEAYVECVRQERFPAYAFELARHWPKSDRPRWWGFFAPSPQLQEEGHVPGAIFAHVDKLDGHIWTHEEQDQLARELGQLEINHYA